jgi:transcriptional regulator EpsA
MQTGNCHVNAHTRTAERGSTSGTPEHRARESGGASLLRADELEALLLNIDASLRVYSRPQLFSWTQGMLQNLLKHELLMCGLRSAHASSYQIDCFASPWIESEKMGELLRRDAAFVAHLVGQWSEAEFHPVLCETGSAGPLARGAMVAELERLGAASVLIHGTYDALGQPVSLFVLAGTAGELGHEHAFLLELIAPFLHLAWMRTQLARPLEEGGAPAERADPLTTREKEILRWIHLGKSNCEIGTILSISPLTVKNHVQKILRKLNVQNRTHAVGKALALRILDV